MEEMTKHEKIERVNQIANEAVDKLMDYLDNHGYDYQGIQELKDDAKEAYRATLDLIWAVSFMREMLEETTNETKETEET